MDSAVCVRNEDYARQGLKPVASEGFTGAISSPIGSVIFAAALIGASAGAHAEDARPRSPGPLLTVALLASESSSDAVAELASPRSAADPHFISPAVIERARQRIRARASVDRFRSGTAHEGHSDSEAAVAAEHARGLAPKLPLPDKVIARTIERIGYPCGAVASIRALDGDEPGLYKVTCTSGHFYQARPVRGRYHFRRL